MIITVGGSIGSGKSTLARKLAEKYGLDYYSVGNIMRSLAKEKGISLLQLGSLAENDPYIDKELDKRQKELIKRGNCVMDSRLGAYFIDADVKIWLDASPSVQTKRIAGREGIPIQDAKSELDKRRASESKRYKGIYGINIENKSIYDIVINTDKLNPEQVLRECERVIKEKGITN